MHAVNFPWQQLAGSFKVKCVTVLKDGTYLGLGEDGTQHTRTSAIGEWVPVGDGERFNWVSQLRDGGILYVGLDGCLYTRATPTSPYTLINNRGTVKAAAQMRNGTIVAVGMDGFLYTCNYLQGEWKQVPNSGTVVGLTILADDTIVGIGADNHLWVWSALAGIWSIVFDSGYVIGIGELSDGSFLGIGTNGLLHKAPRLVVGAQYPGFTPLDFEPDYMYLVQATPAFYKFDTNEQSASDTALRAVYGTGSELYAPYRAYKQRWLGLAESWSFASMNDYKAAWGALISALTGKPYTPQYNPVCLLGNSCFRPARGHAAYFDANANDFTEKHARMFASTNFYRGPGRYSIICHNLQVINIVICADTLGKNRYKIVSRSSGMVLTVKGNIATNGAALVQAPDTGASGQRWYLRLQFGVGHVFVSELGEQRVIDVPGSNMNEGTGLQLWEYNGSAAQCWKMVDLGGGNFRIVSALHGLAIDVPNSSTTADTQLVQWSQNDKLNQQYTLVAV